MHKSIHMNVFEEHIRQANLPIFIVAITANLGKRPNPPFYCRVLVLMNEWWGACWGCAAERQGVAPSQP